MIKAVDDMCAHLRKGDDGFSLIEVRLVTE